MATQAQSPTDGFVWKVIKQVGDAVSGGEDIAILESMKMEIPVTADVDGTVTKLFVVEGQAVAEDDLIAEVE